MSYRNFLIIVSVCCAILLGLLGLIGGLVYVGNYVNPQDVVGKNELIKNQTQILSIIAQALGGLVIFTSVVIAWRTLKANRETQIAERYTTAMDQLGSEHIETRLGAIYSLGRIAEDSPRDYWTIMQILTAYVRVNAPHPSYETLPLAQTARTHSGVQAILNVLKQRSHYYNNGEGEGLDLSRTDLAYAHLEDAHLECADFRSCSLEHAHFQGAFLQRARLEEADLTQAGFSDADLTDADLGGATLNGAHFERAILKGADLRKARLVDVAGLTAEQLEQARFNLEELPDALKFLLRGELSRHV